MCKFIHLRNAHNMSRGGMTIAFDTIPQPDGSLVVEAALAICSTRDNFNRRLGRAISEGRLRKGVAIRMTAPPEVSISDVVADLRQAGVEMMEVYGMVAAERPLSASEKGLVT